ncbi:MAG: hypothetical protein ABS54_16085 [Hyphomicrobium sp. SCN 65-11]|nr:MAG: hypothetical protein ABS54_16085 [Hyphomicrobium sp. SCN 65-11]
MAVTTHDTIIMGVEVQSGEMLSEAVFDEDGPPSIVEHFEIIQVGYYAAHAPPLREMKYLDDDFDLYDDSEMYEVEVQRPSQQLIRYVLPTSNDPPARSRKLLFVIFEEADEASINRADERIKRTLGQYRPVWQGRELRGYCFTHPLRCQEIMEALGSLLEAKAITDYFIVEPLDVPFSNLPLSPLKDWVTRGYKDMGSATFQSRRRDRGGQRGA